MRAGKMAALGVASLGVYVQLVEWVDLYPWNDIRDGNGQESLDLALAAGAVALVLWLWIGGRLAAGAAAFALAIWAWLQISTWWIPYVAGAPDWWKRVYEKWFAETVSFLPRAPEHLPPDANHLVLHLLIVLALFLCVRAALTPGPRAGK